MIVDLFAGPGGWDVGARELGLHPVGLEIDDAACQTRYAAGHATWQQSVPDVSDAQIRALGITGLIASPPCTDFSMAGKRAGIEGDTGRLMFEVPRWVEVARPRWVACEQVPDALPYWRLFAHEMFALGYSCWTGVLCAADYGVPQTRRRAFLLASLDGPVGPPQPTHAEVPSDDLFGSSTLPWVSMADALEVPESWWLDCRQQHEGVPVPLLSTKEPARTFTGKALSQWIWLDENGERVGSATREQASIVQSFPAVYPWEGNANEAGQQIGNAVCPKLAKAVLSSVCGGV